jgi:hypothetical protein
VVAVDPGNPSIVVAGANTNYGSPVNGTLPVGAYWSSDGGKHFATGSAPIVYPFTTAADPTVVVAKDGTEFYSYLGEVPAFCEGGQAAVILAHSIDHGRSFRTPVLADRSSADDKPSLAVESGRPDHVFLVWDRLYDHHSEIWYTRSTDGGTHFGRARALYRSPMNNYGPVVVVAPGGHVSVFWSTFTDGGEHRSVPTRILMRSSSDDGAHFTPARTVAGPFDAMPQLTQPGSLRNLTMPAVTADDDGVLWLAWARPTAHFAGGRVNASIEIKRSTNGGKDWSLPVAVNDVTAGDRFMPALSVWPDRSVGVAFYDRRRSANLLDVYGARVWFRGEIQVSPNVRLNRTSAPVADIDYIAPGSTCFAPGRFFGDYIGVSTQPHGILCAVWADTQLQVAGETDIWFARAKVTKSVRVRRAQPSAVPGRPALGRDGSG